MRSAMERQSKFDVGRVSAISDGVFAIAMTSLVLDLKLPELEIGVSREALAAVVLQQGPRFASWLLSFAILARLWIVQHALLVTGDTRSRGFMSWTFLFLGAVSFTPFPIPGTRAGNWKSLARAVSARGFISAPPQAERAQPLPRWPLPWALRSLSQASHSHSPP